MSREVQEYVSSILTAYWSTFGIDIEDVRWSRLGEDGGRKGKCGTN
jgi:hypothetical protein